MEKITKLSDVFDSKEETKRRVDEIFEFLRVMHPTATEERFHNPIEIRFLERKETGTVGLHSCSLFGLNETSKQFLIEKIEEYGDKSTCMYFSPYKYDYYKECELKKTKRNGEKYTTIGQPMKIKKINALGTQVLAMDFDNMNYATFLTEKERLDALGIETYVTYTGHGFQAFILLDKYVEDTTLFETFTKKLLLLGFKVDSKIVDPSRVLRLIATINFKEFDLTQYPAGERNVFETKVMQTTEKRYSVDEIFSILDQAIEAQSEVEPEEEEDWKIFDAFWGEKTVTEPKPQEIKAEKKTEKPPVPKEKGVKKKQKETEHSIKGEQYFVELYKHLDFKNLQSQLKQILMGVDQGVRNDALLFLLPFLKNELGLPVKEIKETLAAWGENCSPAYEPAFVSAEVDRLLKYDVKTTYGKYTHELEELYGKLSITHAVVSDREIAIENRLFKVIDKLEGAALKIYLTLKLLEKEEGKRVFTKEEIASRAEVDPKTIQRGMKCLVLTKLVNKKASANKQTGEKYMYSVNTLGSDVYGYTKIQTATVELMIIRNLSKFEFAFYVFMCAKTWSSTESILYMSQENIAEAIGSTSQSAISKITDKLAKLKFIRKEVKKDGLKTICQYTLLK